MNGTADFPLSGRGSSDSSSVRDGGKGRVLMASSLNLMVTEAVPASLVLEGASPIALAKAVKNEQELKVREWHTSCATVR